jgi:hypothetical protein
MGISGFSVRLNCNESGAAADFVSPARLRATLQVVELGPIHFRLLRTILLFSAIVSLSAVISAHISIYGF